MKSPSRMLKKQQAFNESFSDVSDLKLPEPKYAGGDDLQRSVSFSGNADLEQLLAGHR